VRFAQGLLRDEAAVRAAIREPWSQGRTEGYHDRIKRTIRMTNGRTNFPLLRARLLASRDATRRRTGELHRRERKARRGLPSAGVPTSPRPPSSPAREPPDPRRSPFRVQSRPGLSR
jgi:hypothetical protein